jgi:hypothetical protein
MYNEICETLEKAPEKYPILEVKLILEDETGRYYECRYNQFMFKVAVQPLKSTRVIINFYEKMDETEAEYWQTKYKFAYQNDSNLNHTLGILGIRDIEAGQPTYIIHCSTITNLRGWVRDVKNIVRMAKYRQARETVSFDNSSEKLELFLRGAQNA